MQQGIFHDDIEGIALAQNAHIDKCFAELKKDFGDPVNVIEIGTYLGGFAVFLKGMFPKSNVHTFDVMSWGHLDQIARRNYFFQKLGITYYEEDCFIHEGRRIKSLLNSKSILLCDGAHKVNEFTFFSQFLQSGSIIMAHDYGRDEEYFRQNIEGKYWTSSFEFDGSKFDKWCEDHSLEPYMQDVFEKAVWYIRIKK